MQRKPMGSFPLTSPLLQPTWSGCLLIVFQPALHEAVGKISWLLGKWKGEGCGVYPTISPFMYGEEIVFNHVGQPMLSYK